MKATCPKDPSHKRFITVAHVTEDWVVDPYGNYQDKFGDEMEVVADPHPDNTWTCATCGATATVDRYAEEGEEE
jgi:hypothetical protein